MKRTFNKWDKFRLGHKLHQLQKRFNRAIENGYMDKASDYNRKISKIVEKLKNIQ